MPSPNRFRNNISKSRERRSKLEKKDSPTWKTKLIETAISAPITALITALFTAGITMLSLKGTFMNWEAQHRIETSTKMLSEKMLILREMSETYTQYINFDVEVDFMGRVQLIRTAMKMVHPQVDLEPLKNLPALPNPQQMRYHHELWSKLGSLSTLAKLYFGEDIQEAVVDFEQELLSNPATLSPVQITDPRSLIGLVGQLKEIDVTNPVQMWNTITPYLLTPRPNPSVSTAYREMLSAMKASIDSEMN